MSEDNPPAYQPVELNPYHDGYDQNNAKSYDKNTPPPLQPSNDITMQHHSEMVNVQQQTSAVLVSRQRGSDLTLPSILVCLFCCFCTGLPAIMYAAKAQNRYGEGKWKEGEYYQNKACSLMITSVILHFIAWTVFLVLHIF